MIRDMTREEAIKNLKKLKSFHNGSYGTAIDLAIKLLEQQPKIQECEHCIHTYGTLGCCDMVNNEWIYDCEFGKEQYKKEHEQQPCEDCISRLIVQEEITKSIALKENPYQMYERIQAIPSVTPQRLKGKWIDDIAYHDLEGCPCCITRCNQCGREHPVSNYCPNCGADMRGEEENE